MRFWISRFYIAHKQTLAINIVYNWSICTVTTALCEMCPNTEFFLVRIQSVCGKIRTRKNSVFGHVSCSAGQYKGSLFLLQRLAALLLLLFLNETLWRCLKKIWHSVQDFPLFPLLTNKSTASEPYYIVTSFQESSISCRTWDFCLSDLKKMALFTEKVS